MAQEPTRSHAVLPQSPKYIPTGPNSRTPDSHGQTSGSGSVVVARTGRLQTTATALT